MDEDIPLLAHCSEVACTHMRYSLTKAKGISSPDKRASTRLGINAISKGALYRGTEGVPSFKSVHVVKYYWEFPKLFPFSKFVNKDKKNFQ